ncbi:MAG: lipid-A-disaccharide synthase [Rhodospirillales bacterium]
MKAGDDASDNANGPLVFLIAGEPSGDVLGALLMAALKETGPVRFAGVGGPRMSEQGLDSMFEMSELSLMGLAEVLPHLPRLMRRIREAADGVRKSRPAVLVTIDSPDFSFRVAKRLKGEGVPLVHYVAPSVWAWKPGRARDIASFLDHLLALLPFEPPYFEAEGLACTFVGHPVVESRAGMGDGEAFRRRHGIPAAAPLVSVLPGSRHGETSRLLPVFSQTLSLLKQKRPDLRAVVPTLAAVSAEVSQAASGWPVPTKVIEGEDEKFDAFAASGAALAASGTVALELAMSGTPAVIAYKMNPLTAWLARRLIRVRFANLVNIILDRQAVPEFLQGDCRPQRLAAAIEELLDNEQVRRSQIADAKEAMSRLGLGGPSPSRRAAEVVLEIIKGEKNE